MSLTERCPLWQRFASHKARIVIGHGDQMSKNHIPWPKIKRLENVAQTEHGRARFAGGTETVTLEDGTTEERPKGKLPRTVVYRGKVKLHGTNAAIRTEPDGEEWVTENGKSFKKPKVKLQAQSRKFDINIERDNQGFAAFAAKHARDFLNENVRAGTTIFGEWCGPGIQNGVAINEAPKPFFAVFAVVDGDIVVSDPDLIRSYVDDSHPQVFVIDWSTQPLYIDFAGANLKERAEIAKATDEIDDLCPFAQQHFGVEGVGEGLVFFPLFLYEGEDVDQESQVGAVSYADFGVYGFKSKGGKHNTGKKKKVTLNMTPEKLASIADFVAKTTSQDALFNVLDSLRVGNDDVRELSNKGIGPFIAAVQKDIAAERSDELPDGVTWKQVAKGIGKEALAFYKKMQNADGFFGVVNPDHAYEEEPEEDSVEPSAPVLNTAEDLKSFALRSINPEAENADAVPSAEAP